MKNKIVGILICMLLIGTTGIAIADWVPSDGHKMHFPQMPDPVGWDVNFHDYYLADDWQCTETGPVKDIHFWISWRHDIVGNLPYIQVSIYSNIPIGPGGWSQPLEQLWTRTFTPNQFVIAGPWNGDQGWLEPYGGYFLHDHLSYYQINIKNINAPFTQQNGAIYWLVIQMPYLYPIEIGWKTTQDHFMDAAVWGSPGQWTPIIDPINQLPIDFAFVIANTLPPVPNLDCNGSITWTKVKPGSTVNGTFQVGNIGQPGSLLNWNVTSYPTWGTWTFIPSSGTELAEGSWATITATCVAPSEKNKKFTGAIIVSNTDNLTDNCTIPISLKTPVNLDIQYQLFFERLFERFPHAFPILRHIMGY
jgi:hypothetical protein